MGVVGLHPIQRKKDSKEKERVRRWGGTKGAVLCCAALRLFSVVELAHSLLYRQSFGGTTVNI